MAAVGLMMTFKKAFDFGWSPYRVLTVNMTAEHAEHAELLKFFRLSSAVSALSAVKASELCIHQHFMGRLPDFGSLSKENPTMQPDIATRGY